ncbi:MAG: hypothetical protein FJ217_04185 [Ignavibacteria bacterium]|nr:hypothetical protein [Ignavibacteria bacterium]
MAGGLLSWLFVLSSAGLAIWTLFLFFTLVTLGALGNIFSLLFIGLAAGFALYLKEVLDASTVWDYLRTTLFFHPYASQPILFQEELDKKNIRDVYQETSQKPFPVVRREKPLLTDEEVAQLRREVFALKERPKQSARLKKELGELSAGSPVDISDQWKIWTFEHGRHDFYGRMSGVTIDPSISSSRF